MTFLARHTRLAKELAFFLLFTLFGLIPFPMLIYAVGITIFGSYGGTGPGDFLVEISGEFRRGDLAMIFLVLSPYLFWNIIRGTRQILRRI